MKRIITIGMSILATYGCSTNKNLPLIFGQTQSVGISFEVSPKEPGGNFIFGYKNDDIAIIPVSVGDSSGTIDEVQAEVETPIIKSKDAMSVIGQFSLNKRSDGSDVGLGNFFATGIAAQLLAEGFKKKLENTATAKDVTKVENSPK